MPQHPASGSTMVAPGMRAEQRLRRRQRAKRFLMTVAVHDDRRRPRPKLGSRAPVAALTFQPLLEQLRLRGDRSCLPAIVAGQQIGRVFANRRETAGLEEHDRLCRLSRSRASRRAFSRARDRASSSSPCEMSGRPQQTFGASVAPYPSRSNHVQPGQTNRRVVMIRERVDEQRDTASRRDPVLRACCRNVRRTQAGGVRRRSRPKQRSFMWRPSALRASTFDSGANRLPHRAAPSTCPSKRARIGVPRRRQYAARNSLFIRATSTPTGHSALARPALEAQVQQPRAPPRPAVPRRRACPTARAAARWPVRASSASRRASP